MFPCTAAETVQGRGMQKNFMEIIHDQILSVTKYFGCVVITYIPYSQYKGEHQILILWLSTMPLTDKK